MTIRTTAFLVLFGLILISCSKNEEVPVTYRTTMALSAYDLTYINENGMKVKETVDAESLQDMWEYSFTGEQGDIVFISAKYKDPESSVLVQILVDGKVYKERSSTNDTTSYVTVSGTIPFD